MVWYYNGCWWLLSKNKQWFNVTQHLERPIIMLGKNLEGLATVHGLHLEIPIIMLGKNLEGLATAWFGTAMAHLGILIIILGKNLEGLATVHGLHLGIPIIMLGKNLEGLATMHGLHLEMPIIMLGENLEGLATAWFGTPMAVGGCSARKRSGLMPPSFSEFMKIFLQHLGIPIIMLGKNLEGLATVHGLHLGTPIIVQWLLVVAQPEEAAV
ncbi:hypothetical protein K438DRAFT_1780143 [Mycena galopus ATCC 62051]|nr:hypothetical protein K438DRAFT_1780143 [Mycena galopus ATCC 62051]